MRERDPHIAELSSLEFILKAVGYSGIILKKGVRWKNYSG